MSARRIARELAVILLPQLPKDKKKLEKVDLDRLVAKAVQQLTDYARQCLADANSFVVKAQQSLLEQEVESPQNDQTLNELTSVKLTSAQVREHLDLMERALHMTAEALDIPQIRVESHDTAFLFKLVSTYIDHREKIDEQIAQVKAKWRVERMISIDRDILRLACTEAFFMPEVPINVCISEAVELSHRFADERAAKFINGVLADIAEEAKNFRQATYPKSPSNESQGTDRATSAQF